MRKPIATTPRGPMALMWVEFAAELLDNFLFTRVEFGSSSALRFTRGSGTENRGGARTGGADDLPFLQDCKHEI